jgi:hypothetical protein
MRLDEDKLEALRHWGQALQQANGEELAASGRAILMLIEEIERLRLERWHTRERLDRDEQPGSEEPLDSEAPDDPSPTPSSTLQQRLHRVLRREPEFPSAASPEAGDEQGPAIGSGETGASPQAWIESLRRPR